MAASKMNVQSVSDLQRAWFIGGALFLATVIILTTQSGIPVLFGGETLRSALFAAALLVFAIGIRGSGSVTARRPLGTVALILLAAWLLLGSTLNAVFSTFATDAVPGVLLGFGYVDSFVQFALALVAVMQIGRLRVVPTPWNWVPAWALAAVSLSWLVIQLLGLVLGAQGNTLLTLYILNMDSIVRSASVVLLGVLAIVLADRARRRQPTEAQSISAESGSVSTQFIRTSHPQID
jgi:hypothetical protein